MKKTISLLLLFAMLFSLMQPALGENKWFSSITKAVTEKKAQEQEAALTEIQQKWNGWWYGGMEFDNCTGKYASLEDNIFSLAMQVELDGDGNGTLKLYDVQGLVTADYEDHCFAIVSCSGDEKYLYANSGTCFGGDIYVNHWRFVFNTKFTDRIEMDSSQKDAGGDIIAYYFYLKRWNAQWTEAEQNLTGKIIGYAEHLAAVANGETDIFGNTGAAQNSETEPQKAESRFEGTWYFTSYEYLKYISTPDRQKLHVQLDINGDSMKLTIDKNGTQQVVETACNENNGGIAFAIAGDSSYLLKETGDGRLYMMGAGENNIFPGYQYYFSREQAPADPAIGSNPDYWWEGDWVIYNIYDRSQMKNEAVSGTISFGAYLSTDKNYATIIFPDGTVKEYTYDFLPELMLQNDEGHITVTKGQEGYGSFSYHGADYSFARAAPAKAQKEEQTIDRNVFLHDVDTGKFITYGTPVRVSLDNTPQVLPDDMIPQTLDYGAKSYYYDASVCTAKYNPDRHGYEVMMKLKVAEPEKPAEKLGTGYIPPNPWVYTGDNFETILQHFLLQWGWGNEYTFNAADNSFTADGMQGRFVEEDNGAYSMKIIMDGIERTVYAEDFRSYASEWDGLVLDVNHEDMDSLIQRMIRKEEKESWWIELDEGANSGVAEDRNDNKILFTFAFALSEEWEEYILLTYNGKTINNITLRK